MVGIASLKAAEVVPSCCSSSLCLIQSRGCLCSGGGSVSGLESCQGGGVGAGPLLLLLPPRPPLDPEHLLQFSSVPQAMAGTLAALHSVEPAAVGLQDYGKPTGYNRRQVRRSFVVGPSHCAALSHRGLAGGHSAWRARASCLAGRLGLQFSTGRRLNRLWSCLQVWRWGQQYLNSVKVSCPLLGFGLPAPHFHFLLCCCSY